MRLGIPGIVESGISGRLGDSMAGTIIFNSININAQETNAGVFIGEAVANGWDSHNKNQQSVGMIFTAFIATMINTGNLYLLNDNDVIDTPIVQPSSEPTGSTTQV